MTPEETWTRIDNALAHTAELQAQMQERQLRADEEMAELRRMHKERQFDTEMADAEMAQLRELHKEGAAEMAELRGLHKEGAAEMAQLRQMHKQNADEAAKQTKDLRELHLSLVVAVSQMAKAQQKSEETVNKLGEKMDALAEMQKATDFKFNALIDGWKRNGKGGGPS